MSNITFKGQAANYNVVLTEVEIKNIVGGLDVTSKEDTDQKFKKGIVQSVGLGCPKDKDGNDVLKPGDEILFDGIKSSPVTLNGVRYLIIYFQDVVIIL